MSDRTGRGNHKDCILYTDLSYTESYLNNMLYITGSSENVYIDLNLNDCLKDAVQFNISDASYSIELGDYLYVGGTLNLAYDT
jgi:hypothetical protein